MLIFKMQLAIEREHIFTRHVEVWGDIFPNKSTFWSEEDMDTCLELITDQVKLLESGPGMDVVWILHHACSESVGVTLKKGSWVSTNDVTSVVEVVGHHIRLLTMFHHRWEYKKAVFRLIKEKKRKRGKNLKPPTCICSRSQVLNQIWYLEV
ncbi:unnamed protein product [Mytilus edulis]|uniref:Uncharacterized protein n=1 Tax=Mytilus edulis TaxID=6550 RepID=A0A8S3VHN5_MYTED|nr:unnamed protein product [Mytilus edulis]